LSVVVEVDEAGGKLVLTGNSELGHFRAGDENILKAEGTE